MSGRVALETGSVSSSTTGLMLPGYAGRTGKSAEFLAGLEAMSAFGRLGRPEEIAAVVAFLAGDTGRWITAQCHPRERGTV